MPSPHTNVIGKCEQWVPPILYGICSVSKFMRWLVFFVSVLCCVCFVCFISVVINYVSLGPEQWPVVSQFCLGWVVFLLFPSWIRQVFLHELCQFEARLVAGSVSGRPEDSEEFCQRRVLRCGTACYFCRWDLVCPFVLFLFGCLCELLMFELLIFVLRRLLFYLVSPTR